MTRSKTLVLIAMAACALGFVAAAMRAVGAPDVDPELTLLIRFMALLKFGMALGAVALSAWRLAAPASGRLAAGYIAASALMAAAPGLIWQMAHLIAGAVIFHAGLALFLGCAWTDRGTATAMFARRVARRRESPGVEIAPAHEAGFVGGRS